MSGKLSRLARDRETVVNQIGRQHSNRLNQAHKNSMSYLLTKNLYRLNGILYHTSLDALVLLNGHPVSNMPNSIKQQVALLLADDLSRYFKHQPIGEVKHTVWHAI